MKVILIALSLGFAATTAFSATKPVYFVNGKTVSPETALRAALANQEVLSCKPVEAKLSKSGTSFGLRQVKEKK